MPLRYVDFDKVQFCCFAATQALQCAELPQRVQCGCLYLAYSSCTCCETARSGGRELVILGYCIDAYGQLPRSQIADYMLHSAATVRELLDLLERFAGKYLVFYSESDKFYIFTDATATMPLSYGMRDGCFYAATHPYFMRKYGLFQTSGTAMELLRCSDSAKTLPGDLTLIEDVWQLLPNHYYDSEKQGGVRFDTRDKRFAKAMPVEQCVAFTLPLLLNITKQIKKDFQIHCPITGGWDSRIVLALLKQEQEQVSADYYTLRHQMDPLKDADLCVPRQMAEDYGLTYKVIEDLRAPDELAADFDLIFGENTYSKYFLSLAYTLQQNLNGGAILNGDIVGQIGKASLHRNVPASLFGPRYYCCKLHNYSAGAYSVMKQWKEQAYSVSSAREVCDLFTEEMRLGRWAAAENLIYSTLGLVWINLFNCKKIICSWEMVARKERMSSLIHKGYLKQLDGSLLHYGVNASEPKLYAFFKRNAFGFYIATYLKLFIQRIRRET